MEREIVYTDVLPEKVTLVIDGVLYVGVENAKKGAHSS